MRRILLSACLAVGLVVVGLIVWQGVAAQKTEDEQGKKVKLARNGGDASNDRGVEVKQPLPIVQAVLLNSGVGYFVREGEINGNATVDLSFQTDDINDLLKSMVLQDLGGGQIDVVSYDSYDPVSKTLKSFALDLSANPSYAELLKQARGEQVEVEWQSGGLQQKTTGSILSIEKQRQKVDDEVIEVEMLNLQTPTGLRRLRLKEISRVRFLDPQLESEINRALSVLASSHDSGRKTVTLSFTGQGKRLVRVGYVVENPIWKTSYRLVLDDQQKPFLQGWGIIDNATDEDWENVDVSLVAGRPISFRMNMYEPLYVPRPEVDLQLFASLRPQTYASEIPPANQPPAAPADEMGAFREERERAAAPRPGGIQSSRPSAPHLKESKAARRLQDRGIDVRQTVASATARDLGSFFQYVIKEPVSLIRRRSAMLPIVNQTIEGEKVSIYNESVQPKHPLLGMELKNTTGLHLMQGPITVFNGNSYAGDAQITDIQPKEERLISYAIDLGVEVDPVSKGKPEDLIAVKIVKGILHATYKNRKTKTYNAVNRTGEQRMLLIEHPIASDWTLEEPEKPSTKTRNVYRFKLKVPAGESASQKVVQERKRVNVVALTNLNTQAIRVYLKSDAVSPKIKDALEKAITLKNKVAETQQKISKVQTQIREITQDQSRIRQNMARVPRDSKAYQRYLKKLDSQETQIEDYQEQIKKLRKTLEAQQSAYNDYLLSLNLE